jgi:hypothetical protein
MDAEENTHVLITFLSWNFNTIRKRGECNVETYMAFTGLKKSFDKFNRFRLLEILTADNIPDQIISAICDIQ